VPQAKLGRRVIRALQVSRELLVRKARRGRVELLVLRARPVRLVLRVIRDSLE